MPIVVKVCCYSYAIIKNVFTNIIFITTITNNMNKESPILYAVIHGDLAFISQ